MEKEELERRTRDNEEAIRNLNRICGETISALRSLHERYRKGHEYQLQEGRLNAEEIKDTILQYRKELEERITILEKFRDNIKTTFKTVTFGIPALASLSIAVKQLIHLVKDNR